MQPPIAGQVVLGWDPAFRTGCKLAVVDPTGKVLDTTVIYPTAPTNEKDPCCKGNVKKAHAKYNIPDFCRKRNSFANPSRIIVDLLKEIPGKGTVCHHK